MSNVWLLSFCGLRLNSSRQKVFGALIYLLSAPDVYKSMMLPKNINGRAAIHILWYYGVQWNRLVQYYVDVICMNLLQKVWILTSRWERY